MKRPAKFQLNGIDYLMLGFDHELRRAGLAGNQCQILLELESPIDAGLLEQRLRHLGERYPLIASRRTGGFHPSWISDPSALCRLQVRRHPFEPDLAERLFNEPLHTRQGELIRLDLWEDPAGHASLSFTWAHALMDAPGAEWFLALLGHEDLPLPAAPEPVLPRSPLSLPQRFRTARKNLVQIDEFCQAAPRSLGTRLPAARRGRMRYRVEEFSAEETSRVSEHAMRLCGALGEARYHAAVALVELHRLHGQLGRDTPSYVLPIPVGLRPKGSAEPLFRNQVTMLMTQIMPEHLRSVPDTVTRLRSQIEQGLRDALVESGQVAGDLFRCLPLPIYMAILKRGLRGEICSLFYGDTAAVNPLLTRFMGSPVRHFTHAAAVTPSPGIGVIFYTFGGRLRMTVLHLSNVLSEEQAAGFAAAIKARLLAP